MDKTRQEENKNMEEEGDNKRRKYKIRKENVKDK